MLLRDVSFASRTVLRDATEQDDFFFRKGCPILAGSARVGVLTFFLVSSFPFPLACHSESLNAFRPRASRRCPRGDILLRLLRHTPVDFDRTFEARAAFDHDLRRRQIPDDRTVLLDLDPSLRAHASVHAPVYH